MKSLPAILLSILLRVLFSTLKLKIEAEPKAKVLLNSRKAYLFAFWHGTQISIAAIRNFLKFSEPPYPKKEMFVLISHHGDGRLAADIIERLNVQNVPGSSTRGGMTGAKNLVKLFRENKLIGITPDGPKGPREEVKDGAVRVAEMARAPILPIAVFPENSWVLKSWDRMQIPKPFSTVRYYISDPIEPTAEKLSEEELSEVKEKLKEKLSADLVSKGEIHSV